jgi:hypothetical protein
VKEQSRRDFLIVMLLKKGFIPIVHLTELEIVLSALVCLQFAPSMFRIDTFMTTKRQKVGSLIDEIRHLKFFCICGLCAVA